jgi:protein ImuB
MRFAQRARLSIGFSAKPPLCRQPALEGPEWLAMRHSGTTALSLKWAHDVMRSK